VLVSLQSHHNDSFSTTCHHRYHFFNRHADGFILERVEFSPPFSHHCHGFGLGVFEHDATRRAPQNFEKSHWGLCRIGYFPFKSASIFPLEIVINLLMSLSFLLLILELFLKATLPFNNVALTLFSVFYLALPFSLLSRFTSYSNTENFTPNVVAGILFLTWANDSFAYLVGSKIGKTPFFLRVSPKKTWEGTIGGGIFCMMTAGIIAQFFTQLGLIDWLIVGGIIAVFGTLGDLVESLLKRSVGVKDSGNFMPGHGGFLDRFDAFIFCIPFVYFYLSFVKYL
jgi:CDP-diglyceride synthetase